MKYNTLVLFTTIIILVIFTGSSPAYADYMLSDESTGSTKRITIPNLYEAVKETYLFGKAGTLKNPNDLFIDKQDNIYIADTGNNRIVKLNPDMSLNSIYGDNFGLGLNKPEGVFVEFDGDIYIADTENKRILHITPEGTIVEEFFEPKSEMLSSGYTEFKPKKLYISNTGYLYLIRQYMLMSIDGNNEFKGFIASSNVRISASDILLRIFYTSEQKAKLTKLVPESFLNFLIADDGMIYGTTLTDKAQIKKINGIGKNIYPEDKVYGEKSIDTRGKQPIVRNPELVDIAVDKEGIITVIDKYTNNLYQYDLDGNNIGVFGGPGSDKGQFKFPSSLAVNSKGNIFVLDREKQSIQMFQPTEYCTNIHAALSKYYKGRYVEAVEEWEKVQKMHEGNPIVHSGLGKALYKQGKYKEAMEHYRIADDREGYSAAFNEYRLELLRKKFTIIVLSFAVLLAVLSKIIKLLKSFSEKEFEIF